jgi:hypothetical protein
MIGDIIVCVAIVLVAVASLGPPKARKLSDAEILAARKREAIRRANAAYETHDHPWWL